MADGAALLCVCILFYGSDAQCAKLARRVLNTPMRALASRPVEFRFGCNAVGAETRALVRAAVSDCFLNATVLTADQNAHKYPMMRRMFYERPASAPITVWFDDDSCFAPDVDIDIWLTRLQRQLEHHVLAGSMYRTRLEGQQTNWVKAQKWYTGKEPGPYVLFPAGSWWAAQTTFLRNYDWPPDTLAHRGVDVMLGELCRQQDLAMCHFRDGVWINANAEGVEAAGSKRDKNEIPLGFNYAL